MSSGLRSEIRGQVCVLTLDHPPVNALSSTVQASLTAALTVALAAPEVAAIVLCGDGKGFSAGADISEFGKPGPTARLGDLCLLIENASKPVIAALHGTALGGGLELALAAHYRIAAAGAHLGLPEVNLGLLPGAGGTQRLPRLIGPREALRLMLTGLPVPAPEALALGLVDRVVAGDVVAAAVAMAAEGLAPRRTGDRRTWLKDMGGWAAAVRDARAAQAGNRLPAPARIIDCVEAAPVLTLHQGLGAEEVAFADLAETPEAAGLRYAFFAERRAALPPSAVAAKGVAPLTSLAIWGAGDMVADLTCQALTAGLRVVLGSPDRAALVQALERVAERQEQGARAGLMTEAARDADWSRLTTTPVPEGLAGADLILSGNDTDSAALAGLGAARAGGPGVAITVPLRAGGLAELSMVDGAAPEVAARVLALARRLGWRVVFAGPGGPIELALRQALSGAVAHLEAGGVTRAAVTAALAAYGMGSGPTSFLPAAPAGGGRIVALCLAAMAAEGARMLGDGRARRPLDIDAVALLSGLMPRWEGGPMFQADQRGLLVLRQDLLALAEQSPLFLPGEVIDDLIANGQGFAGLNGR